MRIQYQLWKIFPSQIDTRCHCPDFYYVVPREESNNMWLKQFERDVKDQQLVIGLKLLHNYQHIEVLIYYAFDLTNELTVLFIVLKLYSA